jgi:hypothetical protein
MVTGGLVLCVVALLALLALRVSFEQRPVAGCCGVGAVNCAVEAKK